MTPSDVVPRRLAEGLLVHPLGISSGTSRWAPTNAQPDDARVLHGLRRAVESGVELIDTADSHRCGHAERLIGKVLREYPGHKVRVASTVGRVRGSAAHPYAGPRLRHQLEQSLENLYLDELALYTLASWDFGLGDRYLDPVIEQMRVLRDLGRIRAVGLRGPHFLSSEWSIRRFLHLFDRVRPDVVWTQASGLWPPADISDGEDLAAFTARHCVGLVIASPLAHGLLVGGPGRVFPVREGRTAGRMDAATSAIALGLAELADRFGPSPEALVRLALRFTLQRARNAVVVVGVGDEQEVERYFGCLGRPLSEHELMVAGDVFSRMRTQTSRPEGRTSSVTVNV